MAVEFAQGCDVRNLLFGVVLLLASVFIGCGGNSKPEPPIPPPSDVVCHPEYEGKGNNPEYPNDKPVPDGSRFDHEWYIAYYKDVQKSKCYSERPYLHYSLHGKKEGRFPYKRVLVGVIGEDIVVKESGIFELWIDASRGGTISKYYDLKTDPKKKTNIAANQDENSRYNGLFFIMFKQEHVGDIPERWTATFKSRAIIKIVNQTPDRCTILTNGIFSSGGFGLPATYAVEYEIVSDPNKGGAIIYVKSKVKFTQDFSRFMQVRQALCLNGKYGFSGGWRGYSEHADINPWYYKGHKGKDAYIGAVVNKPDLVVDPAMVIKRDWPIADYILMIGHPKADGNCLLAWVSRRNHHFKSGQEVKSEFMIRMNHSKISNRGSLSKIANSYRGSS